MQSTRKQGPRGSKPFKNARRLGPEARKHAQVYDSLNKIGRFGHSGRLRARKRGNKLPAGGLLVATPVAGVHPAV